LLPATCYLLSLFAGCSILNPDPEVVLRPGCRIRVVEDVTGLPIDSVSVTVFTLYDDRDTIGNWNYLTDDEGVVTFTSEKSRRSREQAQGRGKGKYTFIVACQDSRSFRYFSQRLYGGVQTIRLSRGYLMARAG
jgi:hypothetical protein